jgi:hypothetical protein
MPVPKVFNKHTQHADVDIEWFIKMVNPPYVYHEMNAHTAAIRPLSRRASMMEATKPMTPLQGYAAWNVATNLTCSSTSWNGDKRRTKCDVGFGNDSSNNN